MSTEASVRADEDIFPALQLNLKASQADLLTQTTLLREHFHAFIGDVKLYKRDRDVAVWKEILDTFETWLGTEAMHLDTTRARECVAMYKRRLADIEKPDGVNLLRANLERESARILNTLAQE